MKSMTGYGQGIAEDDEIKLVVDIKSVNAKFLELNFKMSRVFLPIEESIRNIVSNAIKRGTVDVFINYSLKSAVGDSEAKANLVLAKQIFQQNQTIADELCISEQIMAKDILKFPDVLQIEKTEPNMEKLKALVEKATTIAVEDLTHRRVLEGEGLFAALNRCLTNLNKGLTKIKAIAPQVEIDYAEKLRKRIEEMLANVAIDESKLLNEVAFFADKADITEEIDRLEIHLVNFEKTLKDSDPIGKRLEFLAQEMTREINTLGSKANCIQLTNEVLILKNENEKVKEQIRNVE